MSELRDEIQRLSGLLLTELRAAWRARFNSPPPPYQSRALLLHAFAYQLQARQSGDLSRPTRRRLSILAKQFEADPRYAPAPPEQLQPGTVLIRDWNGRRYGVTVTEAGFLYDGVTYASLSKVAQVITGVKWSGPRFFKLADSNPNSEAAST
jgi:Protein of unknown function (DUF2924)